MIGDSMEIILNSKEEYDNWSYSTRLSISAYSKSGEYFNEYTLVLDCSLKGDNIDRTYIQVELADWSIVSQISDFLSHHFEKNDSVTRTTTVSVVDGEGMVRFEGTGSVQEASDIDQLEIRARASEVEFGGVFQMDPYINTFEYSDGDQQDSVNASQLLDFFEELEKEGTGSLAALQLRDDELALRCAPKYNRREFAEAARLAGQIVEERVKEKAPASLLSEYSGKSLLMNAFKADGGPLRIADDGGEQQSIAYLFAGAYGAVRNPLSHRTPDPDQERYLDDLDQQRAYSILHFHDYLLAVLDDIEIADEES